MHSIYENIIYGGLNEIFKAIDSLSSITVIHFVQCIKINKPYQSEYLLVIKSMYIRSHLLMFSLNKGKRCLYTYSYVRIRHSLCEI